MSSFRLFKKMCLGADNCCTSTQSDLRFVAFDQGTRSDGTKIGIHFYAEDSTTAFDRCTAIPSHPAATRFCKVVYKDLMIPQGAECVRLTPTVQGV